MDELGNTYATYAYDHTGRVISSEHAGGAGRVELSYSGLNTTVTTPTEDSRVYFGTTFGGYFRNKYPSYNRIEDGAGSKDVTWRTASPRRKESVVDQEGNRTRFQYDAWSRPTSIRKAAGTPEETETVNVWDTSHNRISERRQAGSTTS
jgi:YD repeat-containing protein